MPTPRLLSFSGCAKQFGRLLTILLLASCNLACRAGTNPSNADIRALLVGAGQRHRIPPMILFAMAFQESGWQQFNADGSTKLNPKDGGIGIMQLTGATAAPFNHDRLMTEVWYNIDCGATVLEQKWAETNVIGDGNGNVGSEKLENWYYAIWAYNSNGYINNPNWQNTPYPHTAHNPTYQDLVYKWIGACPTILTGMWVSCTLSKPSNAEIGSVTNSAGTIGCGQPIANTPSPYHVDANFDGVLDGTTGGNDTEIWVDGGNTASGQEGSMGNPYNTVRAAVYKASATQAVTIHIKPGIYHESMTIHKNIHLVTWGSGTVRIGG